MPVIICTRRTDQGKTMGSLIEEPEELNAESREYFASQVNILSTFSSPLQSLSEQLNLVYPGLLPKMAESELLFQSKKLALQAVTTDKQLTSHYHLDVPHINVSSVSAAQNDAKLIQGLLENVKTFNSIFQDALDKVYSLKPEDDQPLSEIELWRQRSAVIGTLYEAMFTPDFKLIVQVLERVENETVRQFSKLR